MNEMVTKVTLPERQSYPAHEGRDGTAQIEDLSCATLQNIERRIAFHIQGAYANILEVGRCLIEAKESGLVPRGQWEGWVKQQTGMSDRSAQRIMQAAREVSPESAMNRLPISKIAAILALPEGQREEVAVKAVEENQSLRKLKLEIEELRMDLRHSQESEKRARERSASYGDRIIAADHRAEQARKEAENARKNLDIALTERAAMQTERDTARQTLQEILDNSAKFTGISEEAQAEIDRLNAALADAEQMAEYQARQREQAQQELLDLRTQAARGEGPAQEDLTAEAVGMAARTFITSVGYVRHSERLVTLREVDRAQIASYAVIVQRWADDVLRVLESAKGAMVLEEV